jgi:hypothetical protein
MSSRIIQFPLSGRDRRHYVRELRAAEQAHRALPGRVEEAYRAAHRLACGSSSAGRPSRRPGSSMRLLAAANCSRSAAGGAAMKA